MDKTISNTSQNLKSFALAFTSFIIQSLPHETVRKISSVILFGSVAREDSKSSSDVDLFIVTNSNRMKKAMEQEKERFYESEIYRKYWRLLGVKNEIKPICGRLEEWPELRKSIINDGIVLYGKYVKPLAAGSPNILIWWEPIKNQSKRVLLSKQLYGFRSAGKDRPGLIRKIRGCQKIGSNTLLVQIEQFPILKELFDRHGILFRQKIISIVE